MHFVNKAWNLAWYIFEPRMSQSGTEPPWQWPLVTLSDLQSEGHCIYVRKYDFFRKIREGTSVIPLFDVIFIQESIPDYFSWLFLIIQGHRQGQKVNLKVKNAKIWLSTKTIIGTSVIHHFNVFFIGKNIYVIFFNNRRSSSKSRSRSKS